MEVEPEPDGPPSGPIATVTVPADLRYLDVARTAVRAALAGSGCDAGCERDLQLATDELAAVLIAAARSRSPLEVAVSDDGIDVYIRMVARISQAGFHPQVAPLTRMLLDATVDSYEVRVDGADLLGVLQRALVDERQL